MGIIEISFVVKSPDMANFPKCCMSMKQPHVSLTIHYNAFHKKPIMDILKINKPQKSYEQELLRVTK